MTDAWHALGTVACGPMSRAGFAEPRAPVDLEEVWEVR
jgi:hypothetical protein